MKACSTCLVEQPTSEFYMGTRGKPMKKCRTCLMAYTKLRRANKPSRAPVTPLRSNKSLRREQVAELLEYDQVTGVFTWKVKRGRVAAGSQAGSIDAKGYRRIFLWKKGYRAHRLAWLLTHGVWPEETINHINGRKDDNRIANLEDISAVANTKHAYRIGIVQRVKGMDGRFVRGASDRFSGIRGDETK